MKVQAIIPCAGLGKRFKSEIPKPLVMLDGKPIFIRTLQVLEASPAIASVILVVHHNYLPEYEKAAKRFKLQKIKAIVPGGMKRSDSVSYAFKELEGDTDIVLIHDGVRPLVTGDLIERLIESCRVEHSAIAAVPVKPTIKAVDVKTMTVEQTHDRSTLWEVQTPQVFRKDILLQAYKLSPHNEATDDAMLVEQSGVKVKVVMGEYRNIKITTEEDLIIAQALIKGASGKNKNTGSRNKNDA